jgi:Cu-processing system ATP-binding protein
MTSDTVQITQLSKRYGQNDAVRDVDLSLKAGECVALVGHNGAGKSTLIKMMLGLVRPSAGTVRILSEDPAGRRAAQMRAQLGYLPENVVFAPAMTGREMLDFYARLKRQPKAANAALLDRIGLGDAADRRIGTYSKGMRQRLGLAQALIGKPKLLLLDEPTSGLDPASRQDFYDIVMALRDAGATVLLSTHALPEIADRVDRIAIMCKARLVACDTLAGLRALAALPIRIRLDVDGGVGAAAAIGLPSSAMVQLDERRVELRCTDRDKMTILRQVANLGAVADVEIEAADLDDIYAHLMREAAE